MPSVIKCCPKCNDFRKFRKHIGLITILLALITGGLTLFFVLFYPKRCEKCGMRLKDTIGIHCFYSWFF